MDNATTLNQQSISRRTLLEVAGIGAGALALGGAFVAEYQHAEAAGFYKGADISWAPQMEAQGYYWKDSSGVKQDLLTILKGYGISAIRLRTFVNPSNNPVNGHCSITETAAMAVRCKNVGMALDIDFMFGDTWNDAGHQNPPAAWRNMSYSQMVSAMSTYVTNSMKTLKSSGITPEWVQIGNEENAGICHPVGSVSNPSQMTGLLNAAYNAVKSVSPSTQVAVHLAQPQKAASIQHFLDAYKAHGGQWDITAFSSYGSGSSTISGILSNISMFKSRYGKPVMQVEFGGPVNRASATEANLVQYIKGLKSMGALGLFYWEPEGYSPFTGYNMVAWDSSTREPTAAMNGFLNS